MSITFAEGETQINNSAFNNKLSIQKIVIPSSVICIEAQVLRYSSLAYIIVDKGNPVYFSHCDILFKRLEDDKNVLEKYAPKKDGNRFFIDEKTVMLGSCAFECAQELEEIFLHDNIISLGNELTFASCAKLKEIRLPSKVASIPYHAFANCTSLTEVYLPNSEHYSIDESVFKGCVALKAIHSAAENIDDIKIGSCTFEGFNIDECTLYVPSGTRWAYRHHPGFGKFKNIEIETKEINN